VPESWTGDRDRCRVAGIPDSVEFATKPQLARRMLARLLDAGAPVGWVAGDEVYGSDRRLRRWLEERDIPHVLTVKRSEPLTICNGRAEALAARIAPVAGVADLLGGQGRGSAEADPAGAGGVPGPRWCPPR